MASQGAHKEPLGFVVLDVVIPALPAPAVGFPQFDPAVGGVDGPRELIGIDERFDHQDGVAVVRLPIGAEPIQGEAKNPGSEIRHRTTGQQQEAAIVGDETQPATPLFVGPVNPFITSAQMIGGSAEHPNRQPAASRIGGHVVEPFAHRLKASEVVMLFKELVQAGQLRALRQMHAHLMQELLLGLVG